MRHGKMHLEFIILLLEECLRLCVVRKFFTIVATATLLGIVYLTG
jgi:hypothetical protein